MSGSTFLFNTYVQLLGKVRQGGTAATNLPGLDAFPGAYAEARQDGTFYLHVRDPSITPQDVERRLSHAAVPVGSNRFLKDLPIRYAALMPRAREAYLERWQIQDGEDEAFALASPPRFWRLLEPKLYRAGISGNGDITYAELPLRSEAESVGTMAWHRQPSEPAERVARPTQDPSSTALAGAGLHDDLQVTIRKPRYVRPLLELLFGEDE